MYLFVMYFPFFLHTISCICLAAFLYVFILLTFSAKGKAFFVQKRLVSVLETIKLFKTLNVQKKAADPVVTSYICKNGLNETDLTQLKEEQR